MRIVMMGPQGCGKGTQGKLLAETLRIPAYGMGDIFRRIASEGGEMGREIDAYLKCGELVPEKYVFESLVQVLHSDEAREGFVLDGYPRRENQVEELDLVLAERSLDRVVLLDVPLEEAMRRAEERLLCSNTECGEIHSRAHGLAPGDSCRRCGTPVAARADDNESALKQRYGIYERETVPAVDLYAERGILAIIDGVGSEEGVHERIVHALNEPPDRIPGRSRSS